MALFSQPLKSSQMTTKRRSISTSLAVRLGEENVIGCFIVSDSPDRNRGRGYENNRATCQGCLAAVRVTSHHVIRLLLWHEQVRVRRINEWDQEEFPSNATLFQWLCITLFNNRYMFRSYDHLQAEIYKSGNCISIVVYYFIQIIPYMFPSYDHLRAEINMASNVTFRCIYFRLKMVVRPKQVADNLNNIVNNYWNRVALDRNPWTWSNTRNRMQTPKFKITRRKQMSEACT
jgi:hypothetical protein